MLSIQDDGLENFSRAIRCRVELQDARECQVGTVQLAQLDGLRAHFPAQGRKRLCPGAVVQVSADAFPIGPIRTNARVASVVADRDHRGRPVVSASLKFLQWNEHERHALRNRLQAIGPLILTYGLEVPMGEGCLPGFRIINATTEDELVRHFDQEEVAVLILGPRLQPEGAAGVLVRCLAEFPGSQSINIVLNMGSMNELFQDVVDQDRVFYLAHGSISDSQLRLIITAAATRFLARVQREHHDSPSPLDTNHVLEFCLRLSRQIDLPGASATLAEAIQHLVGARTGCSLIYDRATETLCSIDVATREELRESVATGLAGYVARTGEGVRVERVGDDPRYDGDVDNPGGNADDRLISEPIFGAGGDLIGVLTATRNSRSAQFSGQDSHKLRLLAASVGPTLSVLLFQAGDRRLNGMRDPLHGSNLFREEALECHVGIGASEGELLTVIPAWLKRSHLLIVILITAGLGYTMIAKVDENATGPVLIRARDKTSVTANSGGLVSSVVVSAGDRVREGDLLVKLQSSSGDTLLARVKQELRAPRDGLVSDVRVRSGQAVNAGDQIVSIIDEASGNELISFFPGSYAPQIRSGMPIVLKLQGYPDSFEIIPIDSVSTEILGPQEAARYAGKESLGALDVAGPVVIARSLMRLSSFEADGRSYSYHDGMVGEAQVSVHSDPIIVSLIPGLKQILRHPKRLLSIK